MENNEAIKIWLDDERKAPEGWLRSYTAKETILLLKNYVVSEISLDHDLGTDDTGYDVLCWIEKRVVLNKYVPPTINIHTANASARQKMLLAKQSISRLRNTVQMLRCPYCYCDSFDGVAEIDSVLKDNKASAEFSCPDCERGVSLKVGLSLGLEKNEKF